MHTTSTPPRHLPPASDAEIDAAVRAFVTEITAAAPLAGAAAGRYERAVEAIAEEVTEILATMAAPR